MVKGLKYVLANTTHSIASICWYCYKGVYFDENESQYFLNRVFLVFIMLRYHT